MKVQNNETKRIYDISSERFKRMPKGRQNAFTVLSTEDTEKTLKVQNQPATEQPATGKKQKTQTKKRKNDS